MSPKRVEPGSVPSAADVHVESVLRQLGGRIAELREIPGLTLAALEERTGLSYSTIMHAEHGTANLSVANAVKLAHALGVYVGELFATADRSGVRRSRRRPANDEEVDVEQLIRDSLVQLGARVVELRKERDIRAAALAELAGLSLRTLTYVERGENSTTVRAVALLARALGVHVSELFLPPTGAAARIRKPPHAD